MCASKDKCFNEFIQLRRTANFNLHYSSKEINKMSDMINSYAKNNSCFPKNSKVMRSQFIRWGFRDINSKIIEKTFPDIKYIYLIRKNFYDIVVSDYMAHEMNKWTIQNKSNFNKICNMKIKFNQIKALNVFDNLYYECIENNWTNYLEGKEEKYIKINFKELTTDTKNTVKKIFEFLKLGLCPSNKEIDNLINSYPNYINRKAKPVETIEFKKQIKELIKTKRTKQFDIIEQKIL